jgi:response regulator RpfG family c-di-GMP phosphodiesterase
MFDSSKTRKLTVLLVGDDEAIRTLVRMLLRGRGFRVLAAKHGEVASRVCERFRRPIDAVITDAAMAGHPGWVSNFPSSSANLTGRLEPR